VWCSYTASPIEFIQLPVTGGTSPGTAARQAPVEWSIAQYTTLQINTNLQSIAPITLRNPATAWKFDNRQLRPMTHWQLPDA